VNSPGIVGVPPAHAKVTAAALRRLTPLADRCQSARASGAWQRHRRCCARRRPLCSSQDQPLQCEPRAVGGVCLPRPILVYHGRQTPAGRPNRPAWLCIPFPRIRFCDPASDRSRVRVALAAADRMRCHHRPLPARRGRPLQGGSGPERSAETRSLAARHNATRRWLRISARFPIAPATFPCAP
jgi:hypothetical protein